MSKSRGIYTELPVGVYEYETTGEVRDIENGDFKPHLLREKENEAMAGKPDPDEEEEEEVEREQWGHKMDFILSSIGFAVGLGNVWRFPYLCYKNGGGAFLIPYIFFLAIAGLPLFIMEFTIGQFSSLGCVSVWNFAPIFRGLGIGMVVVAGIVAIYYNIIVTWTIYFMGASCQSVLPWSNCNNTWNTEHCFDGQNRSVLNESALETLTRPSEEYWLYRVHRLSPGLDDMGSMNWDMFGAFVAAWLIVYLCIIKGVKSAGKVVYFTAVFPYVVLFILLIRGVTLPGAGNGIKFYITPNFTRLASPEPWKDAANQIFYSLGMSFGSLITFASYNKFHNNSYRDAIMVAIINCATSVFAGFVIFSILGFMAYDSNLEVDQVVDSGPGLAFIVYPEAVARLPLPQLWSFLFFFMLLTLGLDSQFAMTEAVITAVSDELPVHLRKYKWAVTLGLVIVLFLLGLPMCMQGGLYVLTLMDWYAAYFSLFVMSATYSLVISYVYGLKRFVNEIKAMIGYKILIYWPICWGLVTPLALLVIVIMSFVFYTPAYYGDYTFPSWAQAIGWLLACASFVVIPAYACYSFIFQAEGSMRERLRILTTPTWDWGPALNVDRIHSGYKPFKRGRGGKTPKEWTGGYATEDSQPTTNGIYSMSNGRYKPDEPQTAVEMSETGSTGTPPPDYNEINHVN